MYWCGADVGTRITPVALSAVPCNSGAINRSNEAQRFIAPAVICQSLILEAVKCFFVLCVVCVSQRMIVSRQPEPRSLGSTPAVVPSTPRGCPGDRYCTDRSSPGKLATLHGNGNWQPCTMSDDVRGRLVSSLTVLFASFAA